MVQYSRVEPMVQLSSKVSWMVSRMGFSNGRSCRTDYQTELLKVSGDGSDAGRLIEDGWLLGLAQGEVDRVGALEIYGC